MDILLNNILRLVGREHGTAAEMCEALGLNKNSVSDWKAGRTKSYRKYVSQIARFFGVSEDSLYEENYNSENSNSEERDILFTRILELVGDQHGSAINLMRGIGLNVNTFTNWKSGRSYSYRKHAPKIAEYFGVSLDWLLGKTEDREPPKAPESATQPAESVTALPDRSDDDREKAKMIAEILLDLRDLPPDAMDDVLRFVRFRKSAP